MTIEADLRAAVARADADSRVLHDVVHGDAGASVDTEGGPVKTVARAIADVEAAVAAVRSTVFEARDDAVAARDAVIAAGAGNVLVSDADTTAGKLSAKMPLGRGLEGTIENAGGDESLRIDVTPQLNAGALVALAEKFI